MPLQIRLRHALGERVLELPERGVSQPLIVGRDREADVQVPSIGMAPRHCVLFVHEDRWVVQPMAGKVFLNGEALAGPRGLRTGDVIALGDGASAPILEIDPIGAAERRSGPVTVAQTMPPPRRAAVRPTAPQTATPMRPSAKAPAPAPRPAPAPARRPPPVGPRAARAEESPAEQNEPAENDAVDWNLGDSVPATTSLYVPKGPKTSITAMVITLVIGMGALGGLGIYVYKFAHRAPPAPIVIVDQKTSQASPAKPKALFDLDADQAAARQSQAAKNPPVPQTPDPTPDVPAETPAPSRTSALPSSASVTEDPDIVAMRTQARTFDPAWDEIEAARHDVRHIGLSINKYDQYRRDHPGRHTAQLDMLVNEAANWLYWQRLSQLWTTRDELVKEIRHKDTDLKNQPPGEFHDQLAKERADLVAKHDEANNAITNEMGYTGDTAPDLENPTQLQTLSQSCDPAKYAAFKVRVLKYVRDYHGAVWWANP